MNNVKFIVVCFLLLFAIISCKKDAPPIEKINVEGGETVQFETPIEYKNADYFWEFGDGQTSNMKNPEHVYINAGNNLVTLSIYKNGRLKNKFNPYLVNVEQLYVPRIDSVTFKPDYSDYLYKNEEIFIKIHVSPEIEEDDSYKYEILIDGVLLDTFSSKWYTFPDSGYYDCTFKLIDKNGVSGSLDTSIYIGSTKSFLNFHLPDANLGSLGTVSEEYIIVYKNVLYEYDNDYQDFMDYPGPTSDKLIKNGELMSYYGPGPTDYWYWDFEPLDYKVLSNINNGSNISIEVPADDIDDLKIFLLMVGTNGINISESEMQIIPGTIVDTDTLPTPTFFPY